LLTFEDTTGLFLNAARDLSLVTHPEIWTNTRSLEREFACTCHAGSCDDDGEQQSSCVVSFSWGALDTALSLEGPAGVCDFFHDANMRCPHLDTRAIPPLVIDLSYTLTLNGVAPSEETLLSLTQLLRLRASESSRRTTETRPGVNMILRDNRLYPDLLTLQQRVEIPIWHPLGMRGLHEEADFSNEDEVVETHVLNVEENDEHDLSEPHPEEWLPQIMVDVCQDIMHVLAALEATLSYNSSNSADR
jgi:hypothetical protein